MDPRHCKFSPSHRPCKNPCIWTFFLKLEFTKKEFLNVCCNFLWMFMFIIPLLCASKKLCWCNSVDFKNFFTLFHPRKKKKKNQTSKKKLDRKGYLWQKASLCVQNNGRAYYCPSVSWQEMWPRHEMKEWETWHPVFQRKLSIPPNPKIVLPKSHFQPVLIRPQDRL